MIFHRLVRWAVYKYKENEINRIKSRIIIGDNCMIEYPILIEGEELISIGDNVSICANSRLQTYPKLLSDPGSITIGDNCYFCYRLCIQAGGNITIEDNVVMASDVSIISYNHGYNPESDMPYMNQPLLTGTITIQRNCWIGEGVKILPNVVVGHDSVIGAGSVVTKNIPPYSVAAGNPAIVIREYDFGEHVWKRKKY